MSRIFSYSHPAFAAT